VVPEDVADGVPLFQKPGKLIHDKLPIMKPSQIATLTNELEDWSLQELQTEAGELGKRINRFCQPSAASSSPSRSSST
jgi:hypothetical protein